MYVLNFLLVGHLLSFCLDLAFFTSIFLPFGNACYGLFRNYFKISHTKTCDKLDASSVKGLGSQIVYLSSFDNDPESLCRVNTVGIK